MTHIFGSGKGKSTALVCILNLVQQYLNGNKRLYCAFVDLKMV